MHLLEVERLTVSFASPDGDVNAVRGLSFNVDEGEALGIVGESGAGKSVAMQAVTGLVSRARVTGTARFRGEDLLTLASSARRRLLGNEISFVFQDPSSSLHPLYSVGWQIVEVLRAHSPISRSAARRRAVELLGLVGIPSPERRVHDYPHQFSGGMRQRAMIAMAIALNPALLIADEPTTALDVTVQAQILDLLKNLQDELQMALIIITHDLGVIAEVADRVLVMYAGRQVERADVRTLYYSAHHPYTQGLLESLPSHDPGTRLRAIPGQPPSLLSLPRGCPFQPRCRYAFEKCSLSEPDLLPVDGGVDHFSACWLPSNEVGLGAHDLGRDETIAP
ncbi:MAG TPA: ABC transporter ATP-binding protein [Acidimicrobiales bacterium]